MQDALTTVAFVVAIGAVLAVPVLLVQTMLRRRRSAALLRREGPGKPGVKVVGPDARDVRIAELENILVEERRARDGLQANVALYAELCGKYERLIESLSPGLLPASRRGAAGAGGPECAPAVTVSLAKAAE